MNRIIITDSKFLRLYVVYDHPRDYPDHYVVRCWVLIQLPRFGAVSVRHPQYLFLSTDLQPIRSMLFHSGLKCLTRSEGDESVIVESWL